MSSLSSWAKKPLGAILDDIGDGGTPDTNKKEYFGGSIPWVVIQDIKNEISDTRTKITKIGLDSCSAKLWPAETIILSTGATIGEVGLAQIPLATKQGIHGLVCKAEIDSKFLFYKIQTLRDYLKANAQGSTIREVRAPFLKTIDIEFPCSKFEQSKIAEVLSTVDRAIEQTEGLIAKQRRIQTGLMQDLLTRGIDEHGNLRFEETHEFKDSSLGRIPVEWGVSIIEDLCIDIVDCPHSTPRYIPAGVPCIRTADMFPGSLQIERAFCISENEYLSRIVRLIPEKGDIIYSREGERLGIASPVGFEKVCLGQRVMLLRPDDDSNYLLWVMNSSSFYNRVVRGLGATTSPHINVGDIKKTLVLKPSSKEQNVIGNVLTAQNEYLHSISKQIAKLYKVKTALMQDLLTGKVRVTSLLENMEGRS